MTFPTSLPPLTPPLLSVLSHVYFCRWFTFTHYCSGWLQAADAFRELRYNQTLPTFSPSLVIHRLILTSSEVLPQRKMYNWFKVAFFKHFLGQFPRMTPMLPSTSQLFYRLTQLPITLKSISPTHLLTSLLPLASQYTFSWLVSLITTSSWCFCPNLSTKKQKYSSFQY